LKLRKLSEYHFGKFPFVNLAWEHVHCVISTS
jgi:hypothetical protein